MTQLNARQDESPITVGIIGAGPAGLTSAKQALARGFKVIIYEKQSHLGGIWNKFGKGAYPSVKMQSSKLSFHFSDFLPKKEISDFPTRNEVYDYLVDYADYYKVSPHIRYNTSVSRIEKVANQWRISSTHNITHMDLVDIVMVASGELWDANVPTGLSKQRNASKQAKPIPYRTAKDYTIPEEFIGKYVLVVGGGVSGADIAAELSVHTKVDWSVRTPRLFLPRMIDTVYNDELFSYIGRIASQEMPYQEFLSYLDQRIPSYMEHYRQSGALPKHTINNAIHVNDRIVSALANKTIFMRTAFDTIQNTTSRAENENKVIVCFSNGQQQTYDEVIFCTGYALPSYSFIKDFNATDLYEHFIYRKDPTLTIINTPAKTEAFGTACPYFEMIAQYALKTALGELPLPSEEEMEQWCNTHLKSNKARHYYDCWLETIRLGLLTNTIPSPAKNLTAYWDIVSRPVSPMYLASTPLTNTQKKRPTGHHSLDQNIAMGVLKTRLLKSLSNDELAHLVNSGQIEHTILEQVHACPYNPIEASLPYDKPPL